MSTADECETFSLEGMKNGATPASRFTASELAWLESVRAKWAPLSEPQAVLIQRLFRPESVERRGVA